MRSPPPPLRATATARMQPLPQLAAVSVADRGGRAGAERAMDSGEKVQVAAGKEYRWVLQRLAVFPNSTLDVEGVAKRTRLRGQWEMAEGSSGRLAALNLTFEAEASLDALLDIQGAAWRFATCDLRCERGSAPRHPRACPRAPARARARTA